MASPGFAAAPAPSPRTKTGMVDIYGEVWRTGGTKAQTGDQLDDYLEDPRRESRNQQQRRFHNHFVCRV